MRHCYLCLRQTLDLKFVTMNIPMGGWSRKVKRPLCKDCAKIYD